MKYFLWSFSSFPLIQDGPTSVAQLAASSDWRPGGGGFNPRQGWQHFLVEIDHEIFSTVILSLPLIQEGQLSVSGKRKCTTWDHHFSNFGRPPVPDDLCKDKAPKAYLVPEKNFKVFTIYGHGGHLCQWTATILAIFSSHAPRRLHMKFEQHWPSTFRGEVV